MYKSFFGKITLLFLLVVAGLSLSGILASIWISPSELVEQTNLISTGQRNHIRLLLLLGHSLSFLIPGLIYLFLVYRIKWPVYLSPNARLSARLVVWSLIFLLVAYPFIGFLSVINQSLEFPASLTEWDESSILLLESILQMDHWHEFILNVLLIAVLPAIGEELLFRGILQNELERKWRNPHLAIWLAAFLFALIHFQVNSFLPKMGLGILFGYAYQRTGHFGIPVLMHFFNNGMQVAALYMMDQESLRLDDMPEQKVPLYLALISLVLVFWAGKQIKLSNTDHPDESKT